MHPVEFGNTGFYPAFDGAKRAKLAEEMGFDIQGFSENHARSTGCFGEMRDAARATSRLERSDELSWNPIPIQMACSGPRSIALAPSRNGGGPGRCRW